MAPPPQPTFAQLEQAALHIMRLISDTPGLEKTILAVTGDLALAKYLPESHDPIVSLICTQRITQRRLGVNDADLSQSSIDFVISKSSSPGRVRKEIISHPMSPLVEKSGAVFFRAKSGPEVEVKILPDWLCPYLPAAARPARDDPNSLPYISLEDLLVFKVDECGLRERESSKRKEACDAAALLELASEHCPLHLDEEKMDRIEQALHEIVEFTAPEYDKSWWQMRLGKVPDKQRTAPEIFADLATPPSQSAVTTPPTSPGASSKRSSIYSTMSRTSSSTSATSMHSSISSISSIHSSDSMSPVKNGRPRKMSVTNKPKHSRHPSSGPTPPVPLEHALQRLDIGRPASPGVALINRIS